MSVFLEILRCIPCCDDEFHHGDYDETSQRDPFLQSASYDISVRSNSARSCNHLQRRSDPKIYYYEFYPNLPTSSKSTAKQPNNASFESKYNNKPLKRAGEVSQTLSSSSSAKQTPPSVNPSVSSSKPCSSFSFTTYSSKPLSSPPKASSSSTQSSSFSKTPSSSQKPSLSSTGAPPSSSNPCHLLNDIHHSLIPHHILLNHFLCHQKPLHLLQNHYHSLNPRLVLVE
ncbi:putative protein TPRXL [Pistacia vera]|uniref:putative protein TPRXL n=1 Tax=Pistacia vera TaxID=55513 RepID=UPI001263567D|nr:putative protein TPRXL [Pistacia vera]